MSLPSPSPRQRYWFRALWGNVLVWLLLCVLAWLLAPGLIKSQVESRASEQLGRQVTVGSVDFRPWTLELTLNDISMASKDGQSRQLTIARLYADAELGSLWRMAPVLDAVTIERPQLSVTHLGTGQYDLDDILHRLNGAPAVPSPASEPARFAVYNLSLVDGTLDFQDKPHGQTHAVRDLKLGIPFLSNLESQRDVYTDPHLSFSLNGSRFDSSAHSTPFATNASTEAKMEVKALNLTPFLSYLPEQLPVRLLAAVLDADLQLKFEHSDSRPKVKLSGSVRASGVRLADVHRNALLDWSALTLNIADLQPLVRQAELTSVTLTAPHLRVNRDASGVINVAALLGGAPDAPPAKPSASGNPGPWRVRVGQFGISQGRVDWRDTANSGPGQSGAQLGLAGFEWQARSLAWPLRDSIAFKGNTRFTQGPSAGAAGQLSMEGQVSNTTALVQARLEDVPLQAMAPYLAPIAHPRLTGQANATLSLDWSAGAGDGTPSRLLLEVKHAALERLALSQDKKTLASIDAIELADARIDPGQRSASLGQLRIVNPSTQVERDAQGQWMFEKWFKPAPTSATSVAAPTPGPAWKLQASDALLSGGKLGWLDRSTGRRSRLELSQLRIQLRDFVLDSPNRGQLEIAARVAAGRTEPGSLLYRGKLALRPIRTQGLLQASHFPAHALAPYFADRLNLHLLRADTNFDGRVAYSEQADGMHLHIKGDAAIEEFRANTLGSASDATSTEAAEELLSWKLLSLRGLQMALKPGAATRLQVQESILSDFFARIVIAADGRINLQDLLKPTTDSQAPVGPAAPPANLSFGPIRLVAGKVYFSDRFVHPNYSADLSDLNGRLDAFSSADAQDTPRLADLELRGRAQGTASLEVVGKLNPLARPLALDITGKVRDLELPPLSPYSVRHAGHGIERGKLSMDVAYKVQPDGMLTASNKLTLNQLRFGDKVESAPASLPVKLAVALLADKNGVIDIDLPVSGSLNDPQFKLGPVIFKVVVNLIGKALTSPFSLLSGALDSGSGEEHSSVAFEPGSAQLGDLARQSLDKVVQALEQRPSLSLTVVGSASLESERDAYLQQRLEAMLRAELRRAQLSAPAGNDRPSAGLATLTDEQRAQLLREVYRRADIPKPRNFVGMMKDLPASEMQALLLASIAVNDDAMVELAVQRGVAVKDYLASRKIPLARLFLGAAKTIAPEAKWSPRAELLLDTQ